MQYFVSHSSRDKAIVDVFVKEILSNGLRIPSESIFYSSGRATGISMGKNLFEELKEKLKKSSVFIPIFSGSYLDSKPCLVELSASWFMDMDAFPFVIPPFCYKDLSLVLNYGTRIVKELNNMEHLDHFRDQLDKVVRQPFPSVSEWNAAKQAFIVSLNDILSIPAPGYLRGKRLTFKSHMEHIEILKIASTLAMNYDVRSIMICTYPDPKRPHDVEIDFESELEGYDVIATITEAGLHHEITKDLRMA